jgi:ankyrin repeat protein
MQITILDCPTEILWIIASTLQGSDISALARTHSTLYPKLRLALVKYNIWHQNSSSLHWAAKTNNRAFAKTLLSYRADVDAMVDDFSPLMTAARYGSDLVTNILLRKREPRVNTRNANGLCALWYGVEKGSFAVVNRLLQHPRVKIDLPNCQGQTVLWLAVHRGNRELTSLLLSRGANPDIKDQDGFSPWIEACISNKNSIKDLLLDFMFAESPERASKDSVFAGNGGEGSYLYGQGQVQLPTKRVTFAHV